MHNRLYAFSIFWIMCVLASTPLNSAEKEGPQRRFAEIRRFLELKQSAQALAAGRRLILQNPDFYPVYPVVINLAETCKQLDETLTFFKTNSGNMSVNPEFLYGLGLCYKRQGLKSQALSCFEQAIMRGIKFPQVYNDFLDCFEGKDKLDTVQKKWQEQAGDPFYRFGLGLIALETRDFDKAMKLFQDCLPAARQIKNKDLEAACLHEMGRVNDRQNNKTQAISFFRDSLRVSREISDYTLQASCLHNIAVTGVGTDDLSKSIGLESNSYKISSLIYDEMGRALSLNVIGRIYAIQGSYRKSRDSLKTALAIFQKAQSLVDITMIQVNLGIVYSLLGDFEQSLTYLQSALTLAREINAKESEMGSLINIGLTYFYMNDFSTAETFYQQAQEMAVSMQSKYAQAKCLTSIGGCYYGRKQYDKALEAATNAYQIFYEIKNEEQQNNSMINFAEVYFHLGQLAKAREYIDQVLVWANEKRYNDLIKVCHRHLAEIAIKAKEYDKAEAEIRQALAVAAGFDDPQREWQVMVTHGKIFQERGQWQAALTQYQKAADILENMRGQLFHGEYKTNFFNKAQDIYRAIVEIFFTLHQQNSTTGYDKQAFAYCEKAKARTFLDMLKLKKNDIKGHVKPELLTQKKSLEEEIAETQQRVASEQAKPKPDVTGMRKWQAQVGKLQKKYNDLLLKIAFDHPRYAELIGIGTSLGVKDIQRLLKADETVMEYFAGEDGWFAFAIDRDSFVSKKIPVPPAELRAKITALRRPITDFRENKVDRSRIEWDMKTSVELYQTIFAPLESAWLESRKVKPGPEHHLVIVPDDILFYLPFEALAQSLPAAGKEPAFLGLRYAVSYSVSASVLNPMLKKSGSIPARKLLAFANPDFSGRAADTAPSQLSNWRKYFNKAAATALPDTEIEVNAIAQIIGPKETRIYTGKEARKSILQKECDRFAMLHIATHGLLNETDPSYSGLLLANEGSGADDGVLQNYEIYNLDLHARLVVLSACESGLGELCSGEGIIGMSRAFIYAGAEAVMVSLWAVESSTVPLMKFFYQELQKGIDPATALSRAKRQMLHMETAKDRENGVNPANPFFWAPFVIYGRCDH